MPFKSPAIQNKDATSAGNDNVQNASYAVSNTEIEILHEYMSHLYKLLICPIMQNYQMFLTFVSAIVSLNVYI